MQFLIAFDQLINTIFGGYADETFSARCYRRSGDKTWATIVQIIDAIFFLQDGHCYQSFLSEKDRKQLPEVYRCTKQ